MFKVNKGTTGTICEICSKLTIKTQTSFWCVCCQLWTDFTHCPGFLLVTLNKQIPVGIVITNKKIVYKMDKVFKNRLCKICGSQSWIVSLYLNLLKVLFGKLCLDNIWKLYIKYPYVQYISSGNFYAIFSFEISICIRKNFTASTFSGKIFKLFH